MKLILLTSILAVRASYSEFDLSISAGEVLMKRVPHKNCLFTGYSGLTDDFEAFGYDLEDEIIGQRLGVLGFKAPFKATTSDKWFDFKESAKRAFIYKNETGTESVKEGSKASSHSPLNATRVKFCGLAGISLEVGVIEEQLKNFFYYRQFDDDDYIIKGPKSNSKGENPTVDPTVQQPGETTAQNTGSIQPCDTTKQNCMLDCRASEIATLASSNTIHTRNFLSQRFKVKSLYNQDRLYYYYPTQEKCDKCPFNYGMNVHKTVFVFIAPHELKAPLNLLMQHIEYSFGINKLDTTRFELQVGDSHKELVSEIKAALKKRILFALAYKKIKTDEIENIFKNEKSPGVVDYGELEKVVARHKLEKSGSQHVCDGIDPTTLLKAQT